MIGKIVKVIVDRPDVEEKWVVDPKNILFTKNEILDKVNFQEQYFESEVRLI